jgi:hypothetical protein
MSDKCPKKKNYPLPDTPYQGRLEVFGGFVQNIKVTLLIIKKKHNFVYKKKPHQFKLQLT